MKESLDKLWQSHQQTNRAQLSKKTLALIEGFTLNSKDEWWQKPLPKKQEYWKYVKFDQFAGRQFKFDPPQKEANRIEKLSSGEWKVRINDFSQGALWEVSDENSPVQPLQHLLGDEKNLEGWKDFFQTPWGSHYFSALNRSFFYAGLVVEAGKEETVDISIEGSLAGGEDSFLPFHLILRGGERSRIRIRENIDGSDYQGFFLYDRILQLDKSSQSSLFVSETGSEKSLLLQNNYSQVEQEASLQIFDMTLPSQWSRHNTLAKMNAPGASTQLYGLYMNDEKSFCDHHTSIEHLAEQTQSKQLYKGVLSDQAKAVFNGLVYIAPGASQSSSEQLNKNLLLSEKAEVNTKPELQIYNDDVKASHGATIGQMDEEQLFYLVSRGIKPDKAWKTLCRAFTMDIFEDFEDQDTSFLVDKVSQAIEKMQVSSEL